jgi:RimJ/RimL family protein N-acetyltransferase
VEKRRFGVKPFFRCLVGEDDWAWVKARIPVLLTEDMKGIMAIEYATNRPVGAVILDNWSENSVQCHLAIDSPMLLKHGFLEECMDYVFNTCKREKAYGIIPSDNIKAIKLDKHMGFVEVARLKNSVSPGVDAIIMEMTRETSKYIPDR